MKLSPIVIFAYNRPALLKQTIDALKENYLANLSHLIIYADGSKNQTDLSSVNEVRSYIKTIEGFKSLTIIEREINYGLSVSIIDGVTKTLDKYGKIIVLEDDLVTSPHYLKFMNDALDMYEKDEDVISVQGYVYPSKIELPETFFIKGADCQGWGTWTRGWNLFETEGRVLLDGLIQKKLLRKFDFDNNFRYSKMLKSQIDGKTNSWAIRWYASAFLNDRFTLYPGKTLIFNIGFNRDGTNTNNEIFSSIFNSPINTEQIELNRIPIIDSEIGKNAFKCFFRSLSIRRNPKLFYKYILVKLNHIFNI